MFGVRTVLLEDLDDELGDPVEVVDFGAPECESVVYESVDNLFEVVDVVFGSIGCLLLLTGFEVSRCRNVLPPGSVERFLVNMISP